MGKSHAVMTAVLAFKQKDQNVRWPRRRINVNTKMGRQTETLDRWVYMLSGVDTSSAIKSGKRLAQLSWNFKIVLKF